GTKADLVDDAVARAALLAPDAIVVSAVAGEGLEALASRLEAAVTTAEALAEERAPIVILRPGRPTFVVRREGAAFRVVGRGVERWVADTDFEDAGQVAALQRRLVREGVERQLAAAGAREGDEVRIGSQAFDFLPGQPTPAP
ncbi:MAG: Obg family GTPase CgtA, partial [Actinomycetota bacterium]